MEQKQLDDVEPFFGEEFIDEDDLVEIVEEDASERRDSSFSENDFKDKKDKKEKKYSKKKFVSKISKKKEEYSEPDFKRDNKEETKMGNKDEVPYYKEIKIEPVKEAGQVKETVNKPIHQPVHEESKDKKYESLKEPVTKSFKSKKVFDPWEEKEKNEGGIFKEISTWKVVASILVILLIFSVFTQGFQFDDPAALTADALSISKAEEAVLTYINNNLLQPPFTASIIASEDIGSLYKMTLNVAGQSVDSYVTKDGKIFFPQGLDTSINLREEFAQEGMELEEANKLNQTSEEEITTVLGDETAVLGDETAESTLEEIPSETLPEETVAEVELTEQEPAQAAPDGETKQFTLSAKKWLFEPHQLTVNTGDHVILTIEPQSLAFTFALPEFAVEKEVSGLTTIEFTADHAGEFIFFCSSCEDWRGMKGSIVVK